MYVFIDESGCPGFKFDKESSDFFVLTMVVFKTGEAANAASDRISEFRQKIGKNPDFEFHFSSNCHYVREAFLQFAVSLEFDVFCLVLDKTALPEFSHLSGAEFYKKGCELLFDHAKGHLNNATITLDRSGSREFYASVKTCLKRKLNSPDNFMHGHGKRIKKVGSAESKSDNLLQLADMICGAVVRTQKGSKPKDKTWRRLVEPSLNNLKRYPE